MCNILNIILFSVKGELQGFIAVCQYQLIGDKKVLKVVEINSTSHS